MKGKEKKEKKLISALSGIILFLLLMFFAAVIGYLFISGSNFDDAWWPAMGIIGFFICTALALIVLFSVLIDVFKRDIKEKQIRYDNLGLTGVRGVDAEKIAESVREEFMPHGGFYRKTEFHPMLKNAVCYYFSSIECDDVKEDLDAECAKLDALNEQSLNVVFTVILKKDFITKEDYDEVLSVCKSLYFKETVASHKSFHTVNVILYSGGEIFYFDPDKKPDKTIYAYGLRKLKYFLKKQGIIIRRKGNIILR